jgi:hypothetical protein
MPTTTRKIKKKSVLKVDDAKKIPKFELALTTGNINFVLVYADWCGACKRFMKNIWNPMCKGKAMHNRLAVRDDMIKNTSLANAKFDYLPSLLVVDEKGELQTFDTPDGEQTHAMPTPKNVKDMQRIVNVPVFNITDPKNPKPVINTRNKNKENPMDGSDESDESESSDESERSKISKMYEMPNIPTPPLRSGNISNSPSMENPGMPNIPTPSKSSMFSRISKKLSKVYTPTQMTAPQKGGSRAPSFTRKFMKKFASAFKHRCKCKN